MKFRSTFLLAFLFAILPHAFASPASKPPGKDVEADPPRLESILVNAGQPEWVIAGVVAIKPEMPLGPLDVLKGYEIGMNLVVQKMSAQFVDILQAQQANQITREQAEFLLREAYQTAMMQFQVLGALHETLAQDIAQSATPPEHLKKVKDTGAAVVLETSVPGSPGCK